MPTTTHVKTGVHVLVSVALLVSGVAVSAAGIAAVGKGVMDKREKGANNAVITSVPCGYLPYVADYIVTPTPAAPNQYARPSLALAAAATQGDLNGNGKIEICVRGGSAQAPIVYTEPSTVTVDMSPWSVGAGTGTEPVVVFSDRGPESTRWANPSARVLEVDNTFGNVPSRELKIKNIGFYNGVGAISIVSGGSKHLVLEGDIFSGHTQTALSIGGKTSQVTVSKSQFTGNQSQMGPGAIIVAQNGVLNLASNEFSKNRGVEGGALKAIDKAHVSDERSTFTGNQSNGLGGGAIFLIGESIFLGTNTTFQENVAQGNTLGYGDGGALNGWGLASVTCTSCVWKANQAAASGGAMAVYNAGGGIFADNIFLNNQAMAGGGAVRIGDINHTIFTGGSFESNQALGYGGGGAIYGLTNFLTPAPGSLTITGTQFLQNTSVAEGGAIFVPSGDLNVTQATFTGNTALAGGAITKTHFGTMQISDTSFNGNQATSASGGAVYVSGYSQPVVASMSNIFFNNNTAQNEGGAVYGQDWASITINDSQFVGNNAYSAGGAASLNGSDADLAIQNSSLMANHTLATLGGVGGAIACSAGNQGVTIQLVNDNFENNDATVSGGAVSSWGCDLMIDDSTFSSNLAIGGGAISAMLPNVPAFPYDVLITNSTFHGNTAQDIGGAIWSYAGDYQLDQVTFTNNTAVHSGGALSIDSPVQYEISNALFDSNSTNTGQGGGILVNSSSSNINTDLVMENVDGFNNSSYGYGGFLRMAGGSFEGLHLDIRSNQSTATALAGMSFEETDVNLSNSIVAGNTSPVSNNVFVAGIDMIPGTGNPTVQVEYVTIAGNDNAFGGGRFMGTGLMQNIIGAYNGGLQLECMTSVGLDSSVLYSVSPGVGENGCWGPYSQGSDNTNTEPQFIGDGVTTDPSQSTNILNFNFHLQSSSPAVDISTNGGLDADGTPADAGAYGGPNGAW